MQEQSAETLTVLWSEQCLSGYDNNMSYQVKHYDEWEITL